MFVCYGEKDTAFCRIKRKAKRDDVTRMSRELLVWLLIVISIKMTIMIMIKS